jgi:hypothetical protein
MVSQEALFCWPTYPTMVEVPSTFFDFTGWAEDATAGNPVITIAKMIKQP